MAAGLLVACFAGGVIVWVLWSMQAPDTGQDYSEVEVSEDGLSKFTMIQTEASAEAGIKAATTLFIDLRGDPMILRRGQASAASAVRQIAGPEGFDFRRVGPPSPQRLSFFEDQLLATEARLLIALPSNRDDFAFFQARRSDGLADSDLAGIGVVQGVAKKGDLVKVGGEEGSWGSLIDSGGEAQTQADTAIYVETRIENTTSIALSLRESHREPLYEDAIIVLQTDRTLDEVLTSNGFSEAHSAQIVAGAIRTMDIETAMIKGSIVALRLRPGYGGRQLLQMSVYGPEGYIASMAQTGAGRFAPSADPWIKEDLMTRSGRLRREIQEATDVRLLDAVYSSGIRNGLSTQLVGELIVMMSKLYDLDRFAAEGDRLRLLYATNPGRLGEGAGQLLYAEISGPSGEMPCYVTASSDTSSFACFDFNVDGSGSLGGGGQLGGGLIVPVSGAKTSGFGPRHHPILKQVRNHNGVDWAAPTGTPIRAAADGRITNVGVSGGYGNVIYINHGGGIETRYAHMSKFSEKGRKGVQVSAGDVIGYVGTTGRSTGPHLHFEVRLRGQPVDPLNFGGSRQPGAGAVEALVNRIIQVESSGRADAKNPLSTATGLGQFIQSTWLRMMRDYRPDLVATLSRDKLLALRTDPALSREMVRNLARENEAYLRARGHQITSGRLYLAHFLGPAGADKALRARADQTVQVVMGPAVVGANPFLRGKTIADLHNWSNRKMRGRGIAATPRTVVVPPKVKAYRAKVDEVLAGV